MSVDIGTAEGHIILDTTGFIAPLKTAQKNLGSFAADVSLKIGGAFQALGNTIANFGNTINTYISQPLQNLAKSAFVEMSEFEDGMNRAGTLSRASADELRILTEKAKEMGRTTKFSATEASKALQYMALAGWDTKQMGDGLAGIMDLAAASGEELASVSDIVTDALTAMGLKASDSAHFADVLTAATLNSNTTVGMLGEAFKYAAPVAGALGYKIEDLTLALGLMANAGIKGAQAGTSLRTSLTRMSIAPGQVAVEMEKLGLSMYNADRTAKPLSQLMVEIREKFRGLDEQTKITAEGIIFGGRAMTAWGAIIEATEEDFKRLQTVLLNAEGTARKTSEKMLESFAGRLTLLQSAISGFLLQFTEDVLPFAKKVVNTIIDVINKISALEESTRKAILVFVGLGSGIGPLVASFGVLIATLGGLTVGISLLVSSITSLSALVGISATAFTGWGVAIVAGIAAASAAVAALAAAFVDLAVTNEGFQNSLLLAFDDIKAAFSDLQAEVDSLLKQLSLDGLSTTELLSLAWLSFKSVVSPILLWFVNIAKTTLEQIIIFAQSFTQIISGIVDIFHADFKAGFTKVFEGLKEVSNTFFVGIYEDIRATVNAITEFFNLFDKEGKAAKENEAFVREAFSKTSDIFTETAKNHDIYIRQFGKGEQKKAEEVEKSTAKILVAQQDMWDKTGIEQSEAEAEIQEGIKAATEKNLGTLDAGLRQIPGLVDKQRVPMVAEVGKLQTDLVSAGDTAAAGFVGIMDAHLSQLEGIFNDYLSDALDVVDDFADSFQESGTNSAETFSDAIITELQKLPGNFTTQLNAVLTTTKNWSANMAKEAQNMATTFNANAAKTAADLSTKLNNNLNASLSTANSWVTKMGKKGAEGAKLFLSYMLDAVDAQGAEIEKFGKDIAEHLTVGIENHSDWIKNRLKPAYYKIIDEMEAEMGITGKKGSSTAAKAASVAYAGDYSLGYGTIAGTTAQRTATAAAVQTTANTINFYSPKAIDEVEASRLLRKTQQDMLLGF